MKNTSDYFITLLRASHYYMRLAVLIVAVVLYIVTFNHGFNLDDSLVTAGHRYTSQGLKGIASILKSPYYEDDIGYSYEYRPVTHISFAVEHEFFGGSAPSGHVINVLLFALTCLIVLDLLKQIAPSASNMFPICVTLLFVAHPMHAEAVASIKNRDELLALMFALLALASGVGFGRSGGLWRLPVISALLLISFLAKGSAASFILLLPVAVTLVGRNIQRVFLVTIVVSFSAAVYIIVREWELVWYLWPAVALLSTLSILSLVILDGVPLFRNLLKTLSPRIPTGIASYRKLDLYNTLIVFIVLAGLCYGLIGDISISVQVLSAVLILLPFLTGSFNLAGYVVVFAVSLWPVIQNNYFGSSYLTLALITFVVHPNRGRVAFVAKFCALVLSASVAAHYSLFDHRMGLMLLFEGLLDSLFPIVPLLLVMYNGGDLSTKERDQFHSVVLLSVTLGFVLGFNWNDLMQVIAVAVLHPRILNCSYRWRRWVPLFLSVMVVLANAVTYDVPFIMKELRSSEELLAQKNMTDELGNLKLSLAEEDSLVGLSAKNRPLAFLEYPLGIEAPLGERIGSASLVLGHYLVKMFIPWPQAFYYGYDEVPLGDWMNPLAILSLLVHAVLLLLVFYFGRSHPILAFGILAYLSSIFLFSNFLFTIPGMIGDRLTYVASFGFCVSLGYVLTVVYQRLFTAVAKGVFAVAVGTLMVVWSGMTIARATKWKDPLTLMRHDISTVPNSAQAHNILASNLMQASFDPNTEEDLVEMRLEAIHHFRESLRIWPKTMNVWHDLGRAYMIVDDSERALLCFMSAYGLDSTFTYAAWNAAEVAQNLGRDSLAVEYYRHCIRFSPEMEEAYSRLSYIYLIRGEHEKSIAVNRLAIAREPSWRAPYDNMAQVFEAIEMPDSVEAYIRKRNAIGVP